MYFSRTQNESTDAKQTSTAGGHDFVDLSSNTMASMTSESATGVGLVTRSKSAKLPLLCRIKPDALCSAMAHVAPTDISLAAPTAKNEFANVLTLNVDKTSLKLYTIGIILAAEIQD